MRWYSFTMSFCKVPPSRARLTPAFSACAMYIAKITAAGELTSRRRRGVQVVRVQIFHVRERVHSDTAAADLASASGWSESIPSRVGMRTPSTARHARLDDLLESPVRVVGGPEAGEHPHRHNFDRYIDAYAHACTELSG